MYDQVTCNIGSKYNTIKLKRMQETLNSVEPWDETNYISSEQSTPPL